MCKLSTVRVRALLNHVKSFEIAGPAYQALPGFMQETKYQSPPAGRCAWQNSVGTDQDFFPYMKQHPEQLQWFQKLMSVPRDGDWLDVVYFEKEAANVSADRALLVDVGGNIGHQSERLRRKYPDLPGKIIVQDLEENVKVAPQLQGVEFMAHDFFTPQPIKGTSEISKSLKSGHRSHRLKVHDFTTCALSCTIGMTRRVKRF